MLDSVRTMPITDKIPAAYGTSHGLRRRRKHRERVLTGENNAHVIARCVSFSPVKPPNGSRPVYRSGDHGDDNRTVVGTRGLPLGGRSLGVREPAG
jgi:hypothetical protein